jgi:V8-like Glu-specific endopeptidase
VADRREPVLASQTDPETRSVFLLDLRFDNGSAGICSAVLITPRVLLTAAHCVEPALHSSTSVSVKATNEVDDSNLKLGDFITVTAVERHPQWNAAEDLNPHDVACLLLASAPDVVPVPLVRSSPDSLVGQSVRVVGYGRTIATDDDSSGTRRTALVSVTRVTADTIELGAAGTSGICQGDSGGPSFLNGTDAVERVVGVHSAARSSSCGSGSDIRVDAHLAFIDAFVAAHDPAQCTSDGRCASSCAQSDPDCLCLADGRCMGACPGTDPDCPCGADGRCTAGCSTADPDCADCGANGVCAPASCLTADPDCLLDGAVCQRPDECGGRQCLLDARGFSYCSRACEDDDGCQLDLGCVNHLCQATGGTDPNTAKGGCASAPPARFAPLLLLLLGWRRRSSCSTHASTPPR